MLNDYELLSEYFLVLYILSCKYYELRNDNDL